MLGAFGPTTHPFLLTDGTLRGPPFRFIALNSISLDAKFQASWKSDHKQKISKDLRFGDGRRGLLIGGGVLIYFFPGTVANLNT